MAVATLTIANDNKLLHEEEDARQEEGRHLCPDATRRDA
jgi:hypothetical protein